MDTKGKRLRLLYSDLLGVERGKYLFGDVADSGHSAFCVGVYPLTTDKEILDISNQQFDIGLRFGRAHDLRVELVELAIAAFLWPFVAEGGAMGCNLERRILLPALAQVSAADPGGELRAQGDGIA